MLRINSHNKLPFAHKRITSCFLIYYLFQYYKITGFKFTQLDGPCQFVSFCFYFSFETKIINNSSDFSANIFLTYIVFANILVFSNLANIFFHISHPPPPEK